MAQKLEMKTLAPEPSPEEDEDDIPDECAGASDRETVSSLDLDVVSHYETDLFGRET